MSKLGDAKILGGVGSILLFIPGVSIVGYILILIASKYISDAVGEKSIFDDMLYAVVAGIVGGIAAAAIIFAGLLSSVASGGLSALAGVAAGLLVAWIAFIISSIFIRRAYDKMSTKLNVGTFKTAGTLYFIGAILVIILVGFLLLFVAAILQVVAFFSINDTMQGMQGAQEMQPQPMAAAGAQPGTKYCASCGAQLASTATFCSKCGAQQV